RAPESADYARYLASFNYNLLLHYNQSLHAQDANRALLVDYVFSADVYASRFVKVIDEMRSVGMFVDEDLTQKYEEVQAYQRARDEAHPQIFQELRSLRKLTETTPQKSNRIDTPPAFALNPPPPSTGSVPVAPPQPTIRPAPSLAAGDPSASF